MLPRYADYYFYSLVTSIRDIKEEYRKGLQIWVLNFDSISRAHIHYLYIA